MSDTSHVPPEVPAETEVDRLRERVRELEAEVARMRGGAGRDDRRRDGDREAVGESFRETSDRAVDELTRLTRAMALAYAEQLRLAGEALSTFAEEVSRRRPSDGGGSASEGSTDLYSGVMKAVDRSLEIPRKTIDRLREGYDEEPRS